MLIQVSVQKERIVENSTILRYNLLNIYYFNTSRLITNFCISLVPSPIVQSLLSR